MKWQRVVLCVLFLTGAWAPPILGCGDKFLVVGRTTRFQRPPRVRPPSAILVYANREGSLTSSAERLDEVLRKAGYRPTWVATAEQLHEALALGGWDLIVIGVRDRDAVAELMPSGVRSVVVPIGSSSGRALATIDKALTR